jgi:hypothetical protein
MRKYNDSQIYGGKDIDKELYKFMEEYKNDESNL